MEDDSHTSNSHYLTYTFLFKVWENVRFKVGVIRGEPSVDSCGNSCVAQMVNPFTPKLKKVHSPNLPKETRISEVVRNW